MKKIVTLIIFTLLAACSSEPNVFPYIATPSSEKNKAIHVVSHGWHTGFVIPAKMLQKQLPQLKERFGDTPFIEIGWGDKGFYQAQEITTGLTLKALFWPTETVIHAVAVPEKAKQYFSNSQVKKLCLEEDQYASLIQFISGSFAKNKANEILTLQKGIYGNSQFYQSIGDFYFMNTCNKWVAKGLKSAGMNISPTFKLTAESVMDFVSQYQSPLPEDATLPQTAEQLQTTNFDCP